MKLIVSLLFLCGCAHGVEDDVLVDPETKINAPVPPQLPKDDSDPVSPPRECKLVQSVYADNCVLKYFKCSDGSIKFESYCFGPPYVPPWEWIPDPPYYKGKGNE